MEQGLSPISGIKTVRGTHIASPVITARGALRPPHAPTKQDKAIATAEGVRSAFNLPVFGGFIIGLPLSAAGWVAKKMGRDHGHALLSGVGEAVSQGPRMTTNANALHLPADMAKMVADKATLVGGKAMPLAESMTKRSEAWRAGGDKLGATLGKFFAPLRATVGDALGKVNLREPAKKALAFGGRLPVGAGIMAVASTAGIAAILMKRSKASKEHVEALDEMRGLFGASHPIVVEAAKSYTKDQSRGKIATALECANEASFVAFEAVTGANFGTFGMLMAGQMGLSSAQQMFVTENPTANAFAGLKAVEQGMKVPPEQQAFWFQTLLGALPAAQAKGGSRNLLAAASGKELAAKGTTLTQFAELVGNEAKLNTLLSEVSTKMEAAKAAKAAAPAAASHPALHQAAPAAKVTSVNHQGALQATQLQR